MIQPTTALRKISGLKKRIWGVQGGQGAGKTYAISLIIINYMIACKGKEIYVVSAELTKMRDTVIKDFVNIINALGRNKEFTIVGTTSGQPLIKHKQTGSFTRFIGLDKEDVGKGLRSDLVFVNECNKTNFETYRELTSRAKRVILDFNPNEEFWFHKEVMTRDDCEFLCLTFLDNEFLSKEEVNEILHYKKKGYDADGNIINEYWANKWRVYGLGEIGGVEGRVYFWTEQNYNDYLAVDGVRLYTVDWGKQDPFAIGEMIYRDGELFNHELNYMSENEWMMRLSDTEKAQIKGKGNEGFVTWLFTRLGIPKNAIIVCDSNRPEKILALRVAGWENAVAVKHNEKDILDGVDLLQNLDVYYTHTSTNIKFEQGAYKWAVDRFGNKLEKPEDKNNHHMDRIKYGAMFLRNQGIIQQV